MNRLFLTISCALFAGCLSAQIPGDSIVDGFMAQEVVVMAVAVPEGDDETLHGGLPQNRLLIPSSDLGLLLERNGLASVSRTGPPGASATARFKGMSSDHSVFCWNGVPVNSVSLGTCDLSMIPVFFLDKTIVNRDPATSNLPASGFGMTLDLQTSFPSADLHKSYFTASYNSLHNSFFGGEHLVVWSGKENKDDAQPKSIVRRGHRMMSRTRFLDGEMRNDFSYIDIYHADGPVVRQQHNNAFIRGVLQDFGWRRGIHELTAHVWMQRRKANLPALMGKYVQGSAQQDDEWARVMISYNMRRNKVEISVNSSKHHELMIYRDYPDVHGIWNLFSKTRSSVFYNMAGIVWKPNSQWNVGSNLVYSRNQVYSDNYFGTQSTQHFMQGVFDVNWSRNGHRVNLSATQDSRSKEWYPAWAAGYSYHHQLRHGVLRPAISISRKFRMPDMNELFWNPGGNPLLLPEYAMNYHAAFLVRWNASSNFSLSAEPSAYYCNVVDWIQWIPMNANIWSPVNYKHVQSIGAEVPLTANQRMGDGNLTAEVRYIYTKAQVISSERPISEMIYTPNHVGFASLMWSMKALDFIVRHRTVSDRFTDEQNSALRALENYAVSGVSIAMRNGSGKLRFNTALDIDNLFNHQYESVRGYAIPGRVISLTLTIEILHKNKQTT